MRKWKWMILTAVIALAAAGCSKQTAETSDSSGDVESSGGKQINIDDLVVKGKTTIVDFYSEYCGPCMRIAPLLEKLDEKRDDLVVVRVDINRPGVEGIDWQSPIARQFNLESIPHFKIYGPDGKLQLEGDAAYEKINEWLQE